MDFGRKQQLRVNDEEIPEYYSVKKEHRPRKEPHFDENPEEYRKRAGTSDKGKTYEDLLLTYFAFRLANDDHVQNFELSSNDSQLLSLDDVVVSIRRTNDRNIRRYALQMKHAEDDKNIPVASFNSAEGDFGLKKYFDDFRIIKTRGDTDFTYILYTNKTFGKDDTITKKKQKRSNIDPNQEFSIIVKDFQALSTFGFTIYRDSASCPENELFNTALDKDKPNSVFRFEIVRTFDVLTEDQLKEIEDFVDFCSCFYLLTHQAGIEGIERESSELFKSRYGCEADAFKQFHHVISTWSQSEGAKNDPGEEEDLRIKVVLTKDVVRAKIAEALLTPHIVVRPVVKETTDRTRLFEEAVSRFDITLIDSSSDNTADFIWGITSDFSELDQLNQLALKYIYTHENMTNIESFQHDHLVKVLWHMGKVPLVVKVTNLDPILKAISICKENDASRRTFILIGKDLDQQDFPNHTVLRNLASFDQSDELYQNILDSFQVTLQGRGPVTLRQIMLDEHQHRATISTELLLKMVDNPACIGEDLEFIPHDFVQVPLPKNYLKLRTTENVDQVQWVKALEVPIEQLRPYHCREGSSTIFDYMSDQLILISGDTGMGKSILLNCLKNQYDPKFWVVKLNLREHYKKFQKAEENVDLDTLIRCEPFGVVYSDFERKIQDIFVGRRKVVVLWDGVDEMPLGCVNPVCDAIRTIGAEMGLIQWVAARSNLTYYLETEFNIFSLVIENLGVERQKSLLKKCLLRTNVVSLQDVDGTIDCVYRNFSMLEPERLFGVVHNLTLLMEFLAKTGSSHEPLTPEACCRYIVEKKFEHYHKKANVDLANSAMKIILRGSMRYRICEYEKAAMRTLLGHEKSKSLGIDCEMFLISVKFGDHLGLIVSVTDDELLQTRFAHRAYVWYFAGRWWAKHQLDCDVSIRGSLSGSDYQNVVTMGKMVPEEMLSTLYPKSEDIDLDIQETNFMKDCPVFF